MTKHTDLKFFTNSDTDSLLHRFLSTIKDAKYFDVLVGYFRTSGFYRLHNEIEKVQKQTVDLGWEAKGKVFCEIVAPKMSHARIMIDQLEKLMDNTLWPLPKYREMLYLI